MGDCTNRCSFESCMRWDVEMRPQSGIIDASRDVISACNYQKNDVESEVFVCWTNVESVLNFLRSVYFVGSGRKRRGRMCKRKRFDGNSELREAGQGPGARLLGEGFETAKRWR